MKSRGLLAVVLLECEWRTADCHIGCPRSRASGRPANVRVYLPSCSRLALTRALLGRPPRGPPRALPQALPRSFQRFLRRAEPSSGASSGAFSGASFLGRSARALPRSFQSFLRPFLPQSRSRALPRGLPQACGRFLGRFLGRLLRRFLSPPSPERQCVCVCACGGRWRVGGGSVGGGFYHWRSVAFYQWRSVGRSVFSVAVAFYHNPPPGHHAQTALPVASMVTHENGCAESGEW